MSKFEEQFSDFEQKYLLCWLQTNFADYLARNPNANIHEKADKYFEILESGLYLKIQLDRLG